VTNKRFGASATRPSSRGLPTPTSERAISSTGIGEFWIRYKPSRTTSAACQYTHVSIQERPTGSSRAIEPVWPAKAALIGLDAHGIR